MINIIPTVDHEIFGNGKGNIVHNMINPLQRMVDIFDKYQIPLTIFPDVTEISSFKKFQSKLDLDYNQEIFNAVEKQIISLYSKGHDVQLHVHPQWVDATYKNGNWILTKQNRNINDLNSLSNQSFSFLSENKVFLENMIRKVDKDYQIIASRLTNQGWTEPNEQISHELLNLGIKFHSLSNQIDDSGLPYWPICKQSNNCLYEVPIFSVDKPLLSSFSFLRLFIYAHNLIFNSNFAFGYGNNKKKKLTPIQEHKYRQKLDFSHLNYSEMVYHINSAINRSKKFNGIYTVVMISHSKDFFNEKNLDKFLNIMKSEYKGIVSFGKFSNI